MVFSLKTLFVAIGLISSAQAYSTGAGGCSGGQAAVMGFHFAASASKTITTGSLADGGVGLLLDGTSLVAATATNFSTIDIHALTLAGTSPFRGLLVRLSAPSGVDTTTALLEISDDLQEAGTCSAPVVGITHTNSNLKNMQSMSLLIPSEGEVTVDVTVVFANNDTDSIYYYSSYTLNAVAVAAVENPVCEVCGAGLVVGKPDSIVYNPLTNTSPTCGQIEAGGLAGLISANFCATLPTVISVACGCESADRAGDDTGTAETTSSPTMAPASNTSTTNSGSGAAVTAGQQQTMVALAVSGLVAAVAMW